MLGGYLLATQKLKNNLFVLIFLSGPLFLIKIIFVLKDSLYHLLPILLIIPFATLIGICLKILYHRRKQNYFFYSILSTGILISILGYFFTLNWQEYIFSKEYNNSIENLVIKFKTLDGRELNESNLSGKITVLYLWNSSCSICYEKMPELEKLTRTFFDNRDIQIFSVIIPTSIIDTSSIAIVEQLSKKYKVNFAVSLDNSSIVTKNFNFNTFPMVLIIDPNGNLIYKGRFNNKRIIFINNITKILKKEYKKKLNRVSNPKVGNPVRSYHLSWCIRPTL
jgi:cytochrome oxidase Cu insertion factor (SCO1/SenC/PrrC family)